MIIPILLNPLTSKTFVNQLVSHRLYSVFVDMANIITTMAEAKTKTLNDSNCSFGNAPPEGSLPFHRCSDRRSVATAPIIHPISTPNTQSEISEDEGKTAAKRDVQQVLVHDLSVQT